MRKVSVGPLDRRTMRIYGAMSVNVNASRWVTCSAGAIVKKSLSLFRERSFTCTKEKISAIHRKQTGRGQTLSLVAVFGSITLRMSRVSWVREVPTWPCLITKDFGVLSEDDAEGCVPFR